MLKNTRINLKVIQKIAGALDDLNNKVVYVGGAVVSLYINDPAAEDIRPTADIDISLEIASLTELEEIRLYLTKKGFKQYPEDNIICRFRYEDMKLDVMSTKEIGWAPANPWFGPGFKFAEKITIDKTTIKILPLAYYLATKFTAFHSRGSKDARTSHDFEDIVYILDNRTDLVESIQNSPKDVLTYLKKELTAVLINVNLQEAIIGNLFYETQVERLEMIRQKLITITK
jgi:predicted nucleotidyltransferase